MAFLSRSPNDPRLRSLIDYYYFHDSTDSRVDRFLFYPNIKNALTIYPNARFEFRPLQSVCLPADEGQFATAYSGIQTHCRLATIYGPFRKLGVVFQVLGIQYFLPESLSVYRTDAIDISFPHFGESFNELSLAIWETDDLDQRVDLLDQFFGSRLLEFKSPILEKAVDALLQPEQNWQVKELAVHLGVNRKTLLRIFRKELACSVRDFIQVLRFRRALNHYQLATDKPLLTELAYQANYYDQAEFIHHFKRATGYNPKRFFKDLAQIGERETFWTFLK
ncbi:MAG: AraC family transcriptional regulator [Bacteroidota bacterium]